MGLLQFIHLALSISSLFSVLVMEYNLVFAGPTGLTLKLIHIDSPESPLYPGNLTQKERIRRDFQRSKAHHQQLKTKIKSWRRPVTSTTENVNNCTSKSNISSYHPDIAKPPVSFSGSEYLVSIGIGTFPSSTPTFKNYYFMIDSGSDIFWLQCQGCDPCYPQVGDDYYPAEDSDTYHNLPCNEKPLHHLCTPDYCRGDSCAYVGVYADGSYTYGLLASETLTVNSDNDSLERIENFVFGCGMKQKNFIFGHEEGPTEIAGILGLGGGDMSFLSQLGDRGQMKFAYCFQLWTHSRASNTYLRFGSNANFGGGVVVQTTPVTFPRGPTVYYVNLTDISIGKERIGYPAGTFDLTPMGTGGCVFDSGTPFTLISPKLYDTYEHNLIHHFEALNVHTTDDTPDEYDTCFIKPNGFNSYPSITFHFQDADFEVEPEAAFYITDNIFCSAILQDDEDDHAIAVYFGAIQQANHRVLYDVRGESIDKNKISWAKEECVLPS